MASIITSSTYNEGPSVYPCVAPTTCNLPAATTDALGHVTSYSYNGYGQVTQVLKPADSNGAQPQSNYAYTLTGDSGTVSLLTQDAEKVSASVNQVTSFAYNSANKYVLASSTVDTSHLALTTTFTFDAIGNLTAVQSPRTDVTSTLKKARKQLPADRPGIAFIKIPQEWVDRETGNLGLGDDVADLLDEFFNSTARMVLVAFYSRMTTELPGGTAINHVCRQFESRRTRFERSGTWGLFDPDNQVPGWISLNAFLGPMVAAAALG